MCSLLCAGKQLASSWANDHTVWGWLADEDSHKVLDEMVNMPTHRLSRSNPMSMLDQPMNFTVERIA
eukprot:gene9533-10113_t